MSSRLVVLLVSTVLLTACGAGGGRAPGSDTAGTGAPATSGGDAGASAPGAFPLVIERRGGIAGFADRVAVAADGSASVTTKRGPQRGCRLEPATVDALSAAVAAIAAAPGTRPPSGVSDAMTVTVRLGDLPAVVVPDEAGEPGAVVTQVLTRATSADC